MSSFKWPLPDHVLKMIDFAERQKLGKGFETVDEAQSKADYHSERKLHAEIRNLLNLKGIVYFESRMDRKTTQRKGVPDFIFSVKFSRPGKDDPTGGVKVPVPCAWEIKVGNAKLTPEQAGMLHRLEQPPNLWRVSVIHSLKEAADELQELGV